MTKPVVATQTFVTLTTNGVGPEARSPHLVSEGRGFFYPYTRRDHLLPRRERRRWRALVIENAYLRATVLPDLGGRLFSLYDKVSRREVFTSPRRFRFGRIHLRGAWAPVGIEFNFPKGHTVASGVPVTCAIERHADGSASIVSGSVDRVTGMHWEVRMTLRPGVARLFFHNRFANPSPLPHGAMYWHNASVLVSDGFRFQSRANMAYILEDIGPFPWRHGRDYSWYKNRLWSMDLFLVDVPEDWFGCYNHDIEYGALHVADRRRMRGKKFFSWGASGDGRMWSRTFDLAGEHYGELQAGILDTQSQKLRLAPGQALETDECWFPIPRLGDVLQATEHLAVGLRESQISDIRLPGASILTMVATESLGPLTLTCRDRGSGRILSQATVRARPLRAVSVPLRAAPGPEGVHLLVTAGGQTLLDREVPPLKEPTRRAIARARARIHPRFPKTAAGLVAAAREAVNWHRYTHAERLLNQALHRRKRLPDAECELGYLALRRLDLKAAERRFRAALKAEPRHPWAALGLARTLDDSLEAAEYLHAAAAHRATRLPATIALAQLLSRRGRRARAVTLLANLLKREPRSAEARLLLAALEPPSSGHKGLTHEAVAEAPTHPLAVVLPGLRATSEGDRRQAWRRLREVSAADTQVVVEAAVFLGESGLRPEALRLLAAARRDGRFRPDPLAGYLAAHWHHESGDERQADEWLRWAATCLPDGVNPCRPAEVEALRWAARQRPKDANIRLYLGNWLAGRDDEKGALREWRRAVMLDARCAIAHRNIGFTLFRHGRRLKEALAHYRAALAACPDEVEFYLEAARVLALLGRMEERVALLESAPAEMRRTDNWRRFHAVALQDAGRPADALRAMQGADIIPWEGERTLRTCYVECHLALGREALAAGRLDRAERHFKETMRYPPNLLYGEPYHTEHSVGLYHLALVAEARGHATTACACHLAAAEEMQRLNRLYHSADAIYYSALSARRLGRRAEVRRLLAPFLRQWRHLRGRRGVHLEEWMGWDEYRHPFGVGLALKALGRTAEARQAFRMALRHYGPQAELVWHMETT